MEMKKMSTVIAAKLRKLMTKEAIATIIVVAIVMSAPVTGIVTVFWQTNAKIWGYLVSWGLAGSSAFYLLAGCRLTNGLARRLAKSCRGERVLGASVLTLLVFVAATIITLAFVVNMMWLTSFYVLFIIVFWTAVILGE